jgi:hypothetical protein
VATSVIQRSFAGGEISPAMYGRADQVKYATGLRICRNFYVLRYGGVRLRPGLRFVGEVADSTRRHRLIPFVFNADQTYILEFGHQTMRVIRDGAILESSPGTPYVLATPYAESDLPGLDYVQSGDVITLTHRNRLPRELRRTGHTSWTLATITFEPGQARPTNVSASTGEAGGRTIRYRVTAAKAETFE